MGHITSLIGVGRRFCTRGQPRMICEAHEAESLDVGKASAVTTCIRRSSAKKHQGWWRSDISQSSRGQASPWPGLWAGLGAGVGWSCHEPLLVNRRLEQQRVSWIAAGAAAIGSEWTPGARRFRHNMFEITGRSGVSCDGRLHGRRVGGSQLGSTTSARYNPR